MASYTTNLNLKKPAGSENVAIGDINNNMDTIDQAYGTLNSNLTPIAKAIQSITIQPNGHDDIEQYDNYTGFLVIGYLAGISGIAWCVMRSDTTFTVIDLMTGSSPWAYDNGYLTFTPISGGYNIRVTQLSTSATSYLTIVNGAIH